MDYKGKTLVVVDVQKDFYHPEGRLSVKGAEVVVPKIKSIIKDFGKVVFTKDSHPMNHCSFKEQGGPWPVHCVEGTEGCGIPDELIIEAAGKYQLYSKGQYYKEEEYGAFGRRSSDRTQDASNKMALSLTEKGDGFAYTHDPEEIVVCGIAAEYCVLETLKNLVELYKYDDTVIKVYLDGVAKFDPEGTVLEDYMKENKIEAYK